MLKIESGKAVEILMKELQFGENDIYELKKTHLIFKPLMV
jgi:hypothetical protein